jgi:hypothetical protein
VQNRHAIRLQGHGGANLRRSLRPLHKRHLRGNPAKHQARRQPANSGSHYYRVVHRPHRKCCGKPLAETLHAALRRYCEARLARVQRETEVVWRQGLRSLVSGSILFLVGLLLSAGFLEPDVPEFWQNLLGNGVFLVIGWVGLWYPLDLLFFARQPLKREARIVQAISRMPLLVQPADIP